MGGADRQSMSPLHARGVQPPQLECPLACACAGKTLDDPWCPPCEAPSCSAWAEDWQVLVRDPPQRRGPASCAADLWTGRVLHAICTTLYAPPGGPAAALGRPSGLHAHLGPLGDADQACAAFVHNTTKAWQSLASSDGRRPAQGSTPARKLLNSKPQMVVRTVTEAGRDAHGKLYI